MTSRRTWWLLYSLGAAIVIAALMWISALVLRMEAAAQHEASVRIALYRMDFWLGPRIGRERLRPYFEYLPFYAQQRAYTRLLNAIEPGEVITPSPLLTFESDIFTLHFQVDGDGTVASPQIPTGNWLDLAEGGEAGVGYLAPGVIERRQPLLTRVRDLLPPPAQFEACVIGSERLLADLVGDQMPLPLDDAPPQVVLDVIEAPIDLPVTPPPQRAGPSQQMAQQWASGLPQREEVQTALSKSDIGKRAATNYMQQAQQDVAPLGQTAQVLIMPQQGAAVVDVDSVRVDELVPVWLTPDAQPAVDREPDLLLIRRVRIGNDMLYQGVLCDWPALRNALLEQINDLFPEAMLQPEPRPSPALLESGRLLGSVPAMLSTPEPKVTWGGAFTPARTTLALAWLAVIGAVVAAGVTLRSSIVFGEKRSRFASAVTHELRTPLTTFRMYSEMLADGMIRDEQQQQTYLRTLQQESGRLSTLVENVLSYARLEEGRIARHVQQQTVAQLIDRVRDVLQRRADEADMTLVIRNHVDDDAVSASRTFALDAEIIEQILFNLVDNACKYASGADVSDRRIEIDVRTEATGLSISVGDHGPGISTAHQRAIFKAFERGAHGPGDTTPGVGLGLALSRGLAQDLGGELTLEKCSDGIGACFRLSLPRSE